MQAKWRACCGTRFRASIAAPAGRAPPSGSAASGWCATISPSTSASLIAFHDPRIMSSSASPETHGLVLPESGDVERLVLARRNLFAVTNRRGDIAPPGARDLGLFHLDMRHLSHLEVTIAGATPLILSADSYEAL